MQQTGFKISVLVITHNPRMDLLQWGLDSLDAQTMDKSEWEVVVVDNASPTPLDEQALQGGRTFNLRLLREPRLGLSWGRYCGIQNTQSPLMVFLDDDNWFYPDYLEEAWRLHQSDPRMGAFGGIAEAALEKPIQPWMECVLPLLGIRNMGTAPLFSDNKRRCGRAEPIGAGMVFPRTVGSQYISFLDGDSRAALLDRKGDSLASSGDTFLARLSYDLGLCCAYHPALKIKHFMKAGRLNGRYMLKLASAMGRSAAMAERLLDGETRDGCGGVAEYELLFAILRRYRNRVRGRGRGEYVLWTLWTNQRLETAGIKRPMADFLKLRKTRGYARFWPGRNMVQKARDAFDWTKHQLGRVRRAPRKIAAWMGGGG